MSVREDLLAAIRAYTQVADKNPDSRGLVEQLRELESELGKAPDPQRQGPGVIHNPTAHGVVENGGGNIGGTPQVQINIGGDQLRQSHARQLFKRAHRR